MNYMNDDEIAALQDSGLSQDAPYAIEGVSNTQLCLARHYGGIQVRGHHYTYIFQTDELIRRDVVKWLVKHRKKQTAKANGSGDLF